MRPGREFISDAARVAGDDPVLRRRLAAVAAGLGEGLRGKEAQKVDKRAAKWVLVGGVIDALVT